ncbi:CNK3/IPCEF1 fusion protein-like isoform X2 [Lineus longissimus]|uniref:CNK3/IPCEF1 fusion protein-like isoform X2 n=1 Tax=Lineus longissimus TaxID=88925 RepID=UPI00315D076B
MAGVMFGNPNILGWSCEQVAEWFRGLDDVILPYVHFFLNGSINGRKLLSLIPNDLERLGISKIGHQEIILEAIDLLSALHFTLESDNLQSISLKVSCRSKSLYNELKNVRSNPPYPYHKRHSVRILSAVTYVLQASKDMLAWMQKSPFDSGNEYPLVRETVMKLSTEIISAAQNDSLIKESEEKLMDASFKLSEICENLVHNARDPLVIQPATLQIANLRKKPTEELGIHIHSTFNGIHMISAINNQSPAHISGKIEEGDEVIQVNYQTVVGWQHKKLVTLMRENLKEVILTLKRRPHHSSTTNRHKKKKNNLSVMQTFPKVHKRRSGSEQNGCASVPAFISALVPPDQEDGREVDTDNEVFQSGSESTPSLREAKDTKQRRATVSGVSPTLERASLNDSDQTSPESEKDHFDGRKDTIVGTLSITSETHVQKPFPISHHVGADASVDRPGRRQLKFKETPPKLSKNQEPVLLSMSRTDSTRRGKDESSSDEKGADDVKDSRRDTTFNEGSYTIMIVGGIPQKVPTPVDTVDGVQLRHGKKYKAARKVDRRISCKDLGQGDCEGWLDKKKHARGIMQSKWVKRWFVLKAKILYYFRDKADLKAEGLISLPGYKVSQASEIKRKKYAFKLHHTGTTFYFASDRLEDMSKWMNKMALCSISFDMGKGMTASPFAKPGSVPPTIEEQETPYHSESDEESDTSSISSTPPLPDEQASKRNPISGKEKVELHPPDLEPTEVELRTWKNKEKTDPIVGTPNARNQSLESGFKTPDALCHMLDKQDLTIDGKDRKSLRRTIIARSTVLYPVEFDRVKKLQSLERTLKDKESDLKAIESLLLTAEPVTSDELKHFKLKHPHLFGAKHKFLETDL